MSARAGQGTQEHERRYRAEHERRYRAVQSRDSRFDGVFFTAVTSTGIYCRPSCPARTPAIGNVVFYPSAAAAHTAGFRACRRCRPDAVPGSPEWNYRPDVIGRAMRLIADGVVEREGVDALARRVGYSTRQLHRLMTAELGVGPLAIARSSRARTARTLIETTAMSMADIAHAAGFGSIRQFNATFREVYAVTPSTLRHPNSSTFGRGHITVRLAVRQPFDADGLLAFLSGHCLPGVESVRGRTFARTLRLPHGPGVVALTPAADHVSARLELSDLRDMATAVSRCRRLLDLDADPLAVDETLRRDEFLAQRVREVPGIRVPGSVDAAETAVRTIIGQQVSIAGANRVSGRLVELVGERVDLALAAEFGLTHLFAPIDALAELDPEHLPMPRSRGRTIVTLASALQRGDLDLSPGADRTAARSSLLAMTGIGPWTADYLLMRALGDPDVLLTSDLVLRRELERRRITPTRSARWAPWRSYAGMHLWRSSVDRGE